MLALENTSWSSIWNGVERASWIRLANRTGSLVLFTPSSNKMNSSPSIRATVSTGRTQGSRRSPTPRRRESPQPRPLLLVDFTKAVEIHIQDRERPALPCVAPGRPIEPLEKKLPVGKLR